METQGFVLEAGERVQVQGYWEDDELKAAQVTRLSDGQTVTLRDQLGRPAWAGGGQRAASQTETAAAPLWGGRGGQGQIEAPGDGTTTGQAEVDGGAEDAIGPVEHQHPRGEGLGDERLGLDG